MSHVATLIADPSRPVLDDALLRGAAGCLREAEHRVWLADGTAADIPFTPEAGLDVKGLADELRARLQGAPVDVAVQPRAGRRKRLLLADMDSTMIGQECIDELAAEVGLKERISAITERAMRGEIAFEPALRERVALLADLAVEVTDRLLASRISLTPGGPTLVQTMRAHGAYTALVSGGFTIFTGPISQRIGFHEHRGNTLLTENGRLLGRVAEPILGREAKVATLIELRERLALAPSETLAVGDGANDLAMLDEAGLGVAFHAKPAVAAAADVRIDHADLTALLYLQGYRRAEFVAAEPG